MELCKYASYVIDYKLTDKEIMVAEQMTTEELADWRTNKGILNKKRTKRKTKDFSNRVSLTVEEYLEYKRKGVTDERIADIIKTYKGSLARWKKKNNIAHISNQSVKNLISQSI